MDGVHEKSRAIHAAQTRAFMLAAFIGLVAAGALALVEHPARTMNWPVMLTTINPNTAEVESLVRLPGIGIAIAEAIVDYRNTAEAQGQSPAFSSPADLQKVKGIGPVRSARIAGLLSFETE